MNKLSYLLQLKEENNIEEIYRTWQALGSLKINNNTKVFNKDTLFLVDEEGDLKNALIWCNYSYTVDPSQGFENIDWTIAQADKIEKNVYFYQGVASPNFKIICDSFKMSTFDDSNVKQSFTEIEVTDEVTGEKQVKIKTNVDNFLPFKNAQIKTSVISIDDLNYKIAAAELGIPFLNEEELEYNRDTILDICFKPAIDQYYAYFPIVIDEDCSHVEAGTDYEWAYHAFDDDPTAEAYKALPYITVGIGGTGSLQGYSTPMSFLREQMTVGGYGATSGSKWGRSINWNKSVPGPGSSVNKMDEIFLGNATAQAYMNYYRKEYFRDVFKYGKKYVHGHTATGGYLNIHWLCMSNDFSRIDYWMLPQVRKLCTAYALRNIGMLRALIKPNDTNPIDYSLYTSRADALEKEVLDDWVKKPTSLMFALKRGGLGGR